MKWEDVFKVALAVVSSVGGIGVIICFLVKFSSDMIADRLAKKYELRMTKEIAQFKNNIEKKSYISKARFDKEFEIYQKLSEKVLDMTFANYSLFPPFDKVPPTDEEKEKFYSDRYTMAVRTYNEANKLIKATAPFIPAEIYTVFSDIRDNCGKQIDDFTIFFLEPDYQDNRRELREEYKECWKRTKIIINTRDNLIIQLREYLSKLDVIEM